MGKRVINKNNILLSIIQISGKPLYYLLTFFATLLLVILQSIKLLIQKISHSKQLIISKTKQKTNTKSPTINLSFKTISIKPILFITGVGLLLSLSSYLIEFVRSLPSPYSLTTTKPHQSTKIYDRNGELLYKIYENENRTLISIDQLPQHLIEATIAIEDKNFYNHIGISPKGMVRALISNTKNSANCKDTCLPQGGSTITQQLVKNSLLTPEKTIERKIKEIILSLWVETIYSKNEILEMYLNEVAYGGTAYGIEEASRLYFNKPATDLDLAESAFLAGLPNAPTTFSPYGSYPYLAKQRQIEVLEQMLSSRYINQDDLDNALSRPLTLKPNNIDIKAPHFVMYVIDYLSQKYSKDLLTKGGLNIYTTLDLKTNEIVKNNINEELNKLTKLNVNNAASLVTNPSTGEILAMVGSKNFFDFENDGQVNVTTQPRQPGSSIKPITYALAFSNGYTPSTTILDEPVTFNIQGQEPYKPSNYDNRFHGKVTLRTALASSYNIPAIKLLNQLGIDNMVKLATSMGVTTWDNPSRFGLALTLGGGEVKMTDMAVVYGVFANYGKKVPLTPILKITDNNGKTIESLGSNLDNSVSVISPLVAYQINSILSDNEARTPAFGRNSVLNIQSSQVAVKTGTSNDLRDNWTIGYTQNILVATWVGNNDNSPMSSVASGITGASPIWAKTISKLIEPYKQISFNIPETIVKVYICPTTNTLYCQGCPTTGKWEYYVSGTEPTSTCSSNSKGSITNEGISDSRTTR